MATSYTERNSQWIAESKDLMKQEYERFVYRISSVEIQCKEEKFRYLSGRSVDENGKTIEEYDQTGQPAAWLNARNPWNQPNDPQEELWKILCK